MDNKTELLSYEELNHYMRTHDRLINGTKEYASMHYYSQEAGKITAELNTGYHSDKEIIELLSELTGKKVSDTCRVFLPFYSDYGKNIELGKDVFINAACQFQDQGGITIGNHTLIGPKVVIATINHGLDLKTRKDNYLKGVKIGDNNWIGASVVILPGVTLGNNVVIGAGSVVTKDIEDNSVAVGAPAKIIKKI